MDMLKEFLDQRGAVGGHHALNGIQGDGMRIVPGFSVSHAHERAVVAEFPYFGGGHEALIVVI